MKIFLVAGARPNFMKIAPILRALTQNKAPGLEWKLIHTGQHYDFEMSQTFFDELEIPRPDFFLDAGSGSHAEQTSAIMLSFEKICLDEKPDVVLVVGDVNSTLACSIVAKKLLIDVAHVEAGLRSFDRTMPEEINRLVTDAISDYFFVTEESATKHLLREGKSAGNIHFVGHVMIDNLYHQLKKLEKYDASNFNSSSLKTELGRYAFLTLHRPSNVDDKKIFEGIAEALNTIAAQLPIIFAVHPRTRKMLDQYDITLVKSIHLFPPLGYQEALFLWKDAELVLTDSGGLQEETTGLGVPCFTLRNNTERPITVEKGTNLLIGNDKDAIINAFNDFCRGEKKKGSIPELWDGKAAVRIVQQLLKN